MPPDWGTSETEISDMDSGRCKIHIHQGKGKKDESLLSLNGFFFQALMRKRESL